MKIYSSYHQMSKEYFDNWTKRYEKVTPVYDAHPREDYHLISSKYPIYVVADGVTLKRNAEGDYPVPSGAFEVAKLFCEVVIAEAEARYDSFGDIKSDSSKILEEIFVIGNQKVKEYNDAQGRTPETIDYREFDLFSTTTALVLIKDGKIYWWSLCDAGVFIFESNSLGHGAQIFQSPEAWPTEAEQISATGSAELSDTEFNKLKKRLFRNAVNERGERLGYGVASGESNARVYLNSGCIESEKDLTIFIYTDGYEDYVKLPEFINIFSEWSGGVESIEVQVNKFMEEKERENIKYARERSLVAVKVD